MYDENIFVETRKQSAVSHFAQFEEAPLNVTAHSCIRTIGLPFLTHTLTISEASAIIATEILFKKV